MLFPLTRICPNACACDTACGPVDFIQEANCYLSLREKDNLPSIPKHHIALSIPPDLEPPLGSSCRYIPEHLFPEFPPPLLCPIVFPLRMGNRPWPDPRGRPFSAPGPLCFASVLGRSQQFSHAFIRGFRPAFWASGQLRVHIWVRFAVVEASPWECPPRRQHLDPERSHIIPII